MRSMIAFVKKEALEHLRSVRLLIIGIVFMVLGVSNPIFAKLTPWLFELLEDSLADGGMSVTGVTVSAIDSWVQFFKGVGTELYYKSRYMSENSRKRKRTGRLRSYRNRYGYWGSYS